MGRFQPRYSSISPETGPRSHYLVTRLRRAAKVQDIPDLFSVARSFLVASSLGGVLEQTIFIECTHAGSRDA